MLLDLEIMLVTAYGWSLYDIDETDVVSLVDFINRLGETGGKPAEAKRKVYIDEVDFF